MIKIIDLTIYQAFWSWIVGLEVELLLSIGRSEKMNILVSIVIWHMIPWRNNALTAKKKLFVVNYAKYL